MARERRGNQRQSRPNKYAGKANDSSELWGVPDSRKKEEEEDDDEEEPNVTEDDKAVRLFDFDAQGKKISDRVYRAGFGEDEWTSTETTTSSESSSSTSESEVSDESYEFDDEDFAELQKLRRNNRPGAPMDPMSRLRMWESSFFINSFMNLENKQQYYFYTVTFGHVNK
ncbi:Sma protein [Toxoplasma gondii TgCatPRC2]|nr:Sma protein [Toxoplasma gondii p89]KFG56472.1 Sma protein [Toxoplasma gondii FOU]KYK65570.1 Sma protein [Toxoplasma gondii TgCatPRC2]